MGDGKGPGGGRPNLGDGKGPGGFGGRPGGWRPGMAMANPAITSLAIIGLMDTAAGKTAEGKAKLDKALDYVVSCKQPDGTIMEPRDRRVAALTASRYTTLQPRFTPYRMLSLRGASMRKPASWNRT